MSTGKTYEKWYSSNKEKIFKYNRNYYAEHKNNPEWIKEFRRKARERSYIQRERNRLDLIKLLGKKCKHCGISNTDVLQFDHINNDGKGDAVSLKTRYYIKNIKQAKKRIQLLCANCHMIKTVKVFKETKYNGIRKD